MAAQGPSSASATPPAESRTLGEVRHGQVLGVTEAAGVLGCHPSYVRRLCHTGALPAQRLSGGWLIEASALDDHRYGRRAHGPTAGDPPAA
ncbi:helix-turn-helix domain-containing protein [Streptomyces xanthophaeus]|uniref:helix-turn-helix domain-containing protein n=1 Tax=Streptomyces xanthophaeus TaxID=67385 RepID=UPI0036BD76C0